ncbi:MAG: hypothetical protein J2P21_30910 [Chloracidobacterium sp.]|nr:hypothetical protein [Chloracidobacterium sp.]
MTESEKIKIIEEQITLAVLAPGVDLSYLPPEESAKLKRALLDVYRLSHARGFKAGAEHAMNSIASFMDPQSGASEIEKLKRWVSERMPENWQELKKSLRAIRLAFNRNSRPRRFPTEALSGNWAVRR